MERHEHKLDFSDSSGGDSCFCDGTDIKACRKRGAGFFGQLIRSDTGSFVGDPIHIRAVSVHTGVVFPVAECAGRKGDMEKVVMIGVMSVLLAIPLKKDKSEFGMLIILTACLLISSLAIWRVRDLLDYLKTLQSYLGSGSIYIKVLFKMIAVTYMAELGVNLCRDAGYGAVAGQIEFFGKLMLLAVSLPVLASLFDVLLRFVPKGLG